MTKVRKVTRATTSSEENPKALPPKSEEEVTLENVFNTSLNKVEPSIRLHRLQPYRQLLLRNSTLPAPARICPIKANLGTHHAYGPLSDHLTCDSFRYTANAAPDPIGDHYNP
ncbi:hypothetical protein ACLOJK_020298 [Asimina triloba]